MSKHHDFSIWGQLTSILNFKIPPKYIELGLYNDNERVAYRKALVLNVIFEDHVDHHRIEYDEGNSMFLFGEIMTYICCYFDHCTVSQKQRPDLFTNYIITLGAEKS